MKKAIVKCRLAGKDEFEQKLYEIEMKFGEVYWQHDRVYVPRGAKRGQNYPRLVMRTEMRAVDKPAKYFLVMRRHIVDSGMDLIYETEVKNYVEAVNMIHQLGFEKRAEVSRQRRELKMGEGIIVFMDKIEGVPGTFAKMEAELTEGESVVVVKDDLVKTFAVLDQKNIVEQAYFEMIKPADA